MYRGYKEHSRTVYRLRNQAMNRWMSARVSCNNADLLTSTPCLAKNDSTTNWVKKRHGQRRIQSLRGQRTRP
jgi:hypothetical protein